MTAQQQQQQQVVAVSAGGAVTFTILYVLWWTWIVMGLIAFVWSLVCLGRAGTPTDKAVGILMSVVLGPFFFLYLSGNKAYCR